MRSQQFEVNDVDLYDEYAQYVDVSVVVDGGQDDDGNEKPAYKDYFVQGHPSEIQPKSGSKRAAESGTVYESTHTMFLPPMDRVIPHGATVDVRSRKGADVHQSFDVVFVANHGSHLELDLKAVET